MCHESCCHGAPHLANSNRMMMICILNFSHNSKVNYTIILCIKKGEFVCMWTLQTIPCMAQTLPIFSLAFGVFITFF
jgi:hypothetical protein